MFSHIMIYIHIHEYTYIYCFSYLDVLKPHFSIIHAYTYIYIRIHTYTYTYMHAFIYKCIHVQHIQRYKSVDGTSHYQSTTRFPKEVQDGTGWYDT